MLIYSDDGDYKITYSKKVANGTANVTLDFNICAFTFRDCDPTVRDFANIVDENKKCRHMSSNNLQDVGVSLIDDSTPEKGLILDYKGTEKCQGNQTYGLQLRLECDNDMKKTQYELDRSSIETNDCSPRIILKTKEACPALSLGTLWHFFNEYYYIFGIMMVFFGLFLIILGGRFHKQTTFLFGQLSVAAFVMIIMFVAVYPKHSPMWVCWLTLFGSLIIGSAAGYGAQRYARAGVLLIGAWIGGILGGVVYGLVVSNFASENPMLALWLTILSCSILVAVLSQIYFDVAIIIGSAIAGSYIFLRVSHLLELNIFRAFQSMLVVFLTSFCCISNTKTMLQIKFLHHSTFTSH